MLRSSELSAASSDEMRDLSSRMSPCENGAQVSCVKCLRAGWGGFEHRDSISTYGEYYGSKEETCGDTLSTFLELGANDKKDLAFKVEGDDHFVDPMPNRVDHCNLTL